MSLATVSNSFPVRKLSEFKDVKLEEGEFLVRKIEKDSGKESTGAIIPLVSQEEFTLALENDVILGAAYEWYLKQVENTCKARIQNGATMLVPDDFSIPAVAANIQLAEVREGRITKAMILAWFNSVMGEKLHRAFREKLGDAISNEKMVETLKQYRDAFVNLGKQKHYIEPQVCANLNKALELVQDNPLVMELKKRIVEYGKEVTPDMMGL